MEEVGNREVKAPRAEVAEVAEPLGLGRQALELPRLPAVCLHLDLATTSLVAAVAVATAIRPRPDGLSGAAVEVVALAKLATLDLTERVVCMAGAEAGAVQL